MTPDEMRNANVPPELTGSWGNASAEARAIWSIGAELAERIDARDQHAATEAHDICARLDRLIELEQHRDAPNIKIASAIDAILAELRRKSAAPPTEAFVERAWKAEDQLHKVECDLLLERERAEKAESARDIYRVGEMASHDRMLKAEARVRELETMLRDLLAVIHRDGGHHTGAVGMNQSYLDAPQVVAKAHAEVDELRARVQELESKLMGPMTRCPQCDELRLEIGELVHARDRACDFARQWREIANEATGLLAKGHPSYWDAIAAKRDRLAAEEDAEK